MTGSIPPHRPHERPRILDVGCGGDPDDRATVAADIRETPATDHTFDAAWDRWPFDDDSVDMVICNHVLEHFDRDGVAHALREAARVTRSFGLVEISVPVGVNSRTDMDHEHDWTWETPEQFSRSHARGWDPDVPLRLIDRDVRLWGVGPTAPITPLLRAAAWIAPGLWTTDLPLTGGELTAVYRPLTTESAAERLTVSAPEGSRA